MGPFLFFEYESASHADNLLSSFPWFRIIKVAGTGKHFHPGLLNVCGLTQMWNVKEQTGILEVIFTEVRNFEQCLLIAS